MKTLTAVCILTLLAVPARVRAGHELPYYPSFYPHEIRLEAADAADLGDALRAGRIHASPGANPFGGALPADTATVASWGGYVVLTFGRDVIRSTAPAARCALARQIAGHVDRTDPGFVFHPYPVTPYHGDYFYHYDLAREALRTAASDSTKTPLPPTFRIKATGAAARLMVGPTTVANGTWQAAIEVIGLDILVPEAGLPLAGRPAPPWGREGWFQAFRLLAGYVSDPQVRNHAVEIYHHLTGGIIATAQERVSLERRLVSLLRSGCDRLVLGYIVRHEALITDFTNGIENVGYDAQTGLSSAIFLRTAKLKDFPWNGVLRLGISGARIAAWNPLAGFTDAFGRLLWNAIGDPALLPAPYRSGWVANRVTWTIHAVDHVPAGALIPSPDGRMRPVAAGARAAVKVTYTLRPSLFHDDSTMTVADAIYPYIMAFEAAGGLDGGSDRAVAAATAPVREALAGIRVTGIDRITRQLWGVELAWQAPIVEVYLRQAPHDPEQAAALAPAWSAVPWTLLVLLEEAARQGIGAISQGDAASRGIAWLDVVRDRRTSERLLRLVDAYAAQGYRPEGLRAFVTPSEARDRWSALRTFYLKHQHWLVTNGPYQLASWSDNSVTLTVFRDLSYPLTVGTYDRYAVPHHGYVTNVERRPGRIEVTADVERVARFARSFEIVREPLGKPPSPEQALSAGHDGKPQCQYIVVSADGRVIAAGRVEYANGGTFTLQIPDGIARSSIILAIVVAENETMPEVTTVALPQS